MSNSSIKERWTNLSLREKRMVAGGSFALIIFIFYFLIWSPISSSVESLRHQAEQDKKIFSWMQSADNRIQTLQKSLQPSTLSSKSLLSTIQTEIGPAGFSKNLTTLRQVDAHSVQLNLKEVAFDSLIVWLTQLSKTHGFQVVQLSAKPAAKPGIANVELVIKG